MPDSTPRTADVASVPDAMLREALEFAVGVAAAGSKIRPPLVSPSGLKPLLKLQRLNADGLRVVRRVLVADESFRDRLATADLTDLVDEIGTLWLRRPTGWEADIADAAEAVGAQRVERDAAAALRKADKRRVAAEESAARVQAELIVSSEALAHETDRRERAEAALSSVSGRASAARDEIAGLQREIERLRRSVEAGVEAAATAQQEIDALRAELDALRTHRDELLVAQAERQPASSTGRGVPGRGGHNLPGVRPLRRNRRRLPLSIPGGLYGDSVAAAEHLVRVPGVALVVDGYNVAKLAWPNLDVSDQRELCIDLLEDITRRIGTDIRVIFDGADVVGASAPRRRLVRVQFSPAGVSADDVVRTEAAAVPIDDPLVVATNDQAIVADMRRAGVNVISSDALLAVAGRQPARPTDR